MLHPGIVLSVVLLCLFRKRPAIDTIASKLDFFSTFCYTCKWENPPIERKAYHQRLIIVTDRPIKTGYFLTTHVPCASSLAAKALLRLGHKLSYPIVRCFVVIQISIFTTNFMLYYNITALPNRSHLAAVPTLAGTHTSIALGIRFSSN